MVVRLDPVIDRDALETQIAHFHMAAEEIIETGDHTRLRNVRMLYRTLVTIGLIRP